MCGFESKWQECTASDMLYYLPDSKVAWYSWRCKVLAQDVHLQQSHSRVALNECFNIGLKKSMGLWLWMMMRYTLFTSY